MAQAVQAGQASGAGHDAGHGHADHPPTSLGLDHRKLLMWAFLASDCVFFASLIATFMLYRNRSQQLGEGPFPSELLDIPFTSVSAGVLLLSSFTMVLAVGSLGRNNIRATRIWLAATSFLGVVFLSGQYFEFTEFYHEGLSLQTNMFGASFFTLTGLHGTHVAIGVLWLLTLLFVSLRGGLSEKDAINVEIAGLYWHFVDIVWIIIFTLVYLIPYQDAPSGEGEQETEAFVRLWHLLPFV